MIRPSVLLRIGVVGIGCFVATDVVHAQVKETSSRILTSTTSLQASTPDWDEGDQSARQGEHPIEAAIRFAQAHLDYIRTNVRDYTMLLVRRERVAGQLRGFEYARVKIREQRMIDGVEVPFGAYMKFLKPNSMRDREILFRPNHHDGEMLVRNGGRTLANFTLWLDPDCKMAMRDNRYPITDLGLENLVCRLIEVAESDRRYGECDVNFYKDAKIDGRPCTVVEVIHPVPRDHFLFHVARIFVDHELHVPIRYAAYSWPEEEDDPMPLLEEYTYRNLNFNVGLSDSEFDQNYPEYKFRKGI